MSEQELKQELRQVKAELANLQKNQSAQAATLILLLGISKTTTRVHPANIAEAVDSLPLHLSVASDLKREAKKLISVYFPQ